MVAGGPSKNEAVTLPIEDYGLIGDTHTAALVGRDGSIDWLCLPRFDSEACFAKLLGDEDNGYWRIAPVAADVTTRRRYRKDTLVLETEFETDTGVVRLIDCMPIREDHPQVVRVIEGVSGQVEMRMQLSMRFGYGSVLPWVRRSGSLITAIAGPDALSLWAPVHSSGEEMTTVAQFTVKEGDQVPFVLDLVPVPRGGAPPGRPPLRHRGHPVVVGGLGLDDALRRPVARCGHAVPHHPEGPDLPAHRGNRGRRHHVAARDARWGPELGLPVLLAARRHLDARVAHAGRLLRRGHGLAQLAGADGGRRSGRSADHVRAGRGAASRRMGGAVARRATKPRPPYASAMPPPDNSSSTSTAR